MSYGLSLFLCNGCHYETFLSCGSVCLGGLVFGWENLFIDAVGSGDEGGWGSMFQVSENVCSMCTIQYVGAWVCWFVK